MRELTDYLYKMRTDHQNVTNTVDSSTYLNTFNQASSSIDLYNPAKHITPMGSQARPRDTGDWLHMMKAMGKNGKHVVLKGLAKPTPSSDRALKEKYIAMKYVGKEMIRQPDTGSELILAQAVRSADLPRALHCVVLRADVDEPDLYGTAPLHYAVKAGDTTMVEFLLQWRADVNVLDQSKRTPLHHAAMVGNAGLLSQLLKRGAQADIRDEERKTALDYALERSTDGDNFVRIVTILRLTMFEAEEQMKEKEKYGITEALESLSTASPTPEASPEMANMTSSPMSRGGGVPGTSRRIGSSVFGDDDANVTDPSAVWGESTNASIVSPSAFSNLRIGKFLPPNHKPADTYS
ncbi:hypothetical protein SeMB42_g07790 [Synchytrium endobioticum]|uniref:Uncharacterized protein n=1 Tax=Synchytrium endobioticum TaxID=286115 RepID=A0A507BPC3_9FUNG|nr:hypothetical protein SeMB42_g07790 [Synchytrium endobioticum]